MHVVVNRCCPRLHQASTFPILLAYLEALKLETHHKTIVHLVSSSAVEHACTSGKDHPLELSILVLS